MDSSIKKSAPDGFITKRQEMVNSQLRARGVHDERVLAVMERVPRHLFVAEEHWAQAYQDHPIPIDEGQTISQPLIVALMLQALRLTGSEVVLEVGTGSGYQTALLAELSRQVYSVERMPALANTAKARLQHLQYENVTLSVGDGSLGLPESAPFDSVIVSAAAPSIPQALLEQLKDKGRLVIPVGPPDKQELLSAQREGGRIEISRLEGCRFVPLIGAQGYGQGW